MEVVRDQQKNVDLDLSEGVDETSPVSVGGCSSLSDRNCRIRPGFEMYGNGWCCAVGLFTAADRLIAFKRLYSEYISLLFSAQRASRLGEDEQESDKLYNFCALRDNLALDFLSAELVPCTGGTLHDLWLMRLVGSCPGLAANRRALRRLTAQLTVAGPLLE